MVKPKSKLSPRAIEHMIAEADWLERTCLRFHYEQELVKFGKRKWFEWFGIADVDRVYRVETAKVVLKELDEIEAIIGG